MPLDIRNPVYPLDTTGVASSNRISDEVHVITQQNHKDFYFIVPKFAPFFADNIQIFFTNISGQTVPLVQGQDYYFGHHFLAASRAIGKQIYGSISFLNKSFHGVMKINYNTIGGNWTYTTDYLNEVITNSVANPRIASWDSVVSLPGLFPVVDHEWNLNDMVGMSEVVAGIFGIEEAIRNPNAESGSQTLGHILNKENPHAVTKLQVGLGSVDNFTTASQAEAEAGNASDRFMTPLRVKQAISALFGNTTNQHIQNTENPHNTTKTQVGLGNVENYSIATQEEAVAGTANDKYVTPLRVKQYVDTKVNSDVGSHTGNTDNPHSVTKAQIGLGSVDNFPTATQAEMLAGTQNKFVTPALVKAYFDNQTDPNISNHLADTANPHNTTAEQLNVYTKPEVNQSLSEKLDKTGTAENTNKFDGKTYLEAVTDILSGTVANADKVYNLTYAQLLTQIDNDLPDASVNQEDVINLVNASSAKQFSIKAKNSITDNTVYSDIWVELFSINVPLVTDHRVIGEVFASNIPFNNTGDNFHIRADALVDSNQAITVDLKIKNDNLNLINSTHIGFGYTRSLGPTINFNNAFVQSTKITVYCKTKYFNREIVITELSNCDFFTAPITTYSDSSILPACVVNIEPLSITYQAITIVGAGAATDVTQLTNRVAELETLNAALRSDLDNAIAELRALVNNL